MVDNVPFVEMMKMLIEAVEDNTKALMALKNEYRYWKGEEVS